MSLFSMQAVKDALHMLENGASIAAAKSICPPHILFQLVKWKVHANVELSSWLLYTNYVLLLFFYIFSFRWYAYTIVVVCQVLALIF
jgi:hypothetical protein